MTIHSEGKGVRDVPSCSSLSSERTLVDDSRVTPPKQFIWKEESLRDIAICWRPNELLDQRHNPHSLFYKYGLFNEEFARLHGLEHNFQRHELPDSRLVELSRSQIVKDAPAIIARKLFQISIGWFKKVPYNEFTRVAFGMSSDAIDDFLFKYELLEVKFYSVFIGAEVERLSIIFEELKICKADPFVYAAIEHALERVKSRRKARVGSTDAKMANPTQILNAQLKKSLHLITKPFAELLSKPGTGQSILEELEVLQTRFFDFYMPVDAEWTRSMDTRNDLLEQLRWVDIPAIARAISKRDKALFSKYLQSASTSEGDEARSILNKQWDSLSKSVKEIVAANIGLCSKIDILANCLYRLRNYYSLTAVIQGIQATRYRTASLETFCHLLNPEDGYRHYLTKMNMKGALHFLFPALHRHQRGNPTYMAMAIDAFKLYTVIAYQSTPEMQFSPSTIASAATTSIRSPNYEKPSLSCPFALCFFVGFRS